MNHETQNIYRWNRQSSACWQNLEYSKQEQRSRLVMLLLQEQLPWSIQELRSVQDSRNRCRGIRPHNFPRRDIRAVLFWSLPNNHLRTVHYCDSCTNISRVSNYCRQCICSSLGYFLLPYNDINSFYPIIFTNGLTWQSQTGLSQPSQPSKQLISQGQSEVFVKSTRNIWVIFIGPLCPTLFTV